MNPHISGNMGIHTSSILNSACKAVSSNNIHTNNLLNIKYLSFRLSSLKPIDTINSLYI